MSTQPRGEEKLLGAQPKSNVSETMGKQGQSLRYTYSSNNDAVSARPRSLKSGGVLWANRMCRESRWLWFAHFGLNLLLGVGSNVSQTTRHRLDCSASSRRAARLLSNQRRLSVLNCPWNLLCFAAHAV